MVGKHTIILISKQLVRFKNPGNMFTMKMIIIQIAVCLFCVSVNAQQAFTNNGNLQIHTGASVNSIGNFTNNASGSFVNNGNFYVAANVTNDQPSLAAGTGTLYLNGSTAQAINGTQVFKTFDLITNNAAGITLNNNLSVSGTHTYTAGMITTSATPNYMTYEAGADYTGSSDTRHVYGWVKKIGSTDLIFPVGNASYQRSVALINLTAAGYKHRRTGNAIGHTGYKKCRHLFYLPETILCSRAYILVVQNETNRLQKMIIKK